MPRTGRLGCCCSSSLPLQKLDIFHKDEDKTLPRGRALGGHACPSACGQDLCWVRAGVRADVGPDKVPGSASMTILCPKWGPELKVQDGEAMTSSLQFYASGTLEPRGGAPGPPHSGCSCLLPLPRLMLLLLRLLRASQTVGGQAGGWKTSHGLGVDIPRRLSTLPGVNVSPPSVSSGSSKGCSHSGPEKPSLTWPRAAGPTHCMMGTCEREHMHTHQHIQAHITYAHTACACTLKHSSWQTRVCPRVHGHALCKRAHGPGRPCARKEGVCRVPEVFPAEHGTGRAHLLWPKGP